MRRRSAPFVTALALVAMTSTAATARAQDARSLGSPAASGEASAASAPVVIVPPPTASETTPPPPPGYGYVPPAPAPTSLAEEPPREGGYAPTWALLGPGLGAFVSTYGGAALAGAEIALSYGTDEETAWLFVPVVGPWVLVGFADGFPDAQLGFALLGLGQTAGAALIIAGLAINARAGDGDDAIALSVAPALSPGSAGLSLAGRF